MNRGGRNKQRIRVLAFAWLLLAAAPSEAGENAPLDMDAPAEEGEIFPISIVPAEEDPEFQEFSDLPMLRHIEYPDWFKSSFLNLPEDLKEAQSKGKQGIILYFSQAHCAYCEAMIEANFAKPDTAAYIQKYFDVIPIDVWGKLPLVTMEGEKTTETEFSNRLQTHFTPYLIFYGGQGEEILRVRGYYPPYVFRAMLDYVTNKSYLGEQRFREYLARSKSAEQRGEGKPLQDDPLFSAPPYNLARHRFPGERLLAVIFEQAECHACDLLHDELLADEVIRQKLGQMEVVRLDGESDTPVLTPAGKATTARAWAEEMGLFYSPTLLFFDEAGEEILRVDSVIRLFRLNHVLDYLQKRAYLDEPRFLRWISKQLHVEE